MTNSSLIAPSLPVLSSDAVLNHEYYFFSLLSADLPGPSRCFRNNNSTENGNSSDKSHYNIARHSNRGQTALNSRWALPVPGRKWHWAPSPSYFILAGKGDDHRFIFGHMHSSQRVSCKLISVFLFSLSAWIPLGLLSSAVRNTGRLISNI